MNQPTVQIRALTPERLPDFLEFFDGTAFSDNPKWSSCYCQCFYEDHRVVKWSERTASENRRAACERIDAGLMQGYLAYSDGYSHRLVQCGPAQADSRAGRRADSGRRASRRDHLLPGRA
jgi:hypothetical protein